MEVENDQQTVAIPCSTNCINSNISEDMGMEDRPPISPQAPRIRLNVNVRMNLSNLWQPPAQTMCQQTEHVNRIRICISRRKLRRVTYLGTTRLLDWYKDKECLIKAVSSHDINSVETLLKKEINPNCSDDKKRTPLHIAAASGDENIVRMLLDYGADPNKRDIIGNTPLHLAACSRNLSIISLLLDKGADVKSMDQMGVNPLQLAVSRLNLLKGNKMYTHDQLKQELFIVITMMEKYTEQYRRIYLNENCESQLSDQLTELSLKLGMTESEKEVDDVNDLLNDLANLQLRKEEETVIE